MVIFHFRNWLASSIAPDRFVRSYLFCRRPSWYLPVLLAGRSLWLPFLAFLLPSSSPFAHALSGYFSASSSVVFLAIPPSPHHPPSPIRLRHFSPTPIHRLISPFIPSSFFFVLPTLPLTLYPTLSIVAILCLHHHPTTTYPHLHPIPIIHPHHTHPFIPSLLSPPPPFPCLSITQLSVSAYPSSPAFPDPITAPRMLSSERKCFPVNAPWPTFDAFTFPRARHRAVKTPIVVLRYVAASAGQVADFDTSRVELVPPPFPLLLCVICVSEVSSVGSGFPREGWQRGVPTSSLHVRPARRERRRRGMRGLRGDFEAESSVPRREGRESEVSYASSRLRDARCYFSRADEKVPERPPSETGPPPIPRSRPILTPSFPLFLFSRHCSSSLLFS
ncbi:hypothetical protein C7M84_013973 [Penaeus vannamei]|uniref:Uncharacterized protein n=1 Tax=Penaeus vannamei TaxID=6689 RepID=A0A3R7Q3Y8_PENVA|nr:hypothetical protein C7M84_013973 [Penaeus vannamei]